jgi:hypothetical protein
MERGIGEAAASIHRGCSGVLGMKEGSGTNKPKIKKAGPLRAAGFVWTQK